MRKYISLIGILLYCSTASAMPQGNWPEEASYITLSKKDWVLVIPARRNENGDIVLWNKDDTWMKEWIVPRQTPRGMKTVAITGDAEDKKMILGSHLENMDINALRRLAQKYKAPAIAVAVEDTENQVAVAGWVLGEGAAWRGINNYSSNSQRNETLNAIDEIFTGYDGYTDPVPKARNARDRVEITGQRQNRGWVEYRLESFDQESINKLYNIPGLEVVGEYTTNSPSVIVRVTDGRDIETVLRSAGISYR